MKPIKLNNEEAEAQNLDVFHIVMPYHHSPQGTEHLLTLQGLQP